MLSAHTRECLPRRLDGLVLSPSLAFDLGRPASDPPVEVPAVKASFPVPVDTNGRGYIARGAAAEVALNESQSPKPSSEEMTQRLDGRIDLAASPAQAFTSEDAPELA